MTVFGSYLKRKHFFFTSSRHLSDLTDVIAKDERKKVKKEIKGRDVSFLMEQLLSWILFCDLLLNGKLTSNWFGFF